MYGGFKVRIVVYHSRGDNDAYDSINDITAGGLNHGRGVYGVIVCAINIFYKFNCRGSCRSRQKKRIKINVEI